MRLISCLLIALLVLALIESSYGVLGSKHIAARKKANLAKKQSSLEASVNAAKKVSTDDISAIKEKSKKTVSFALHHSKKSEEQQVHNITIHCPYNMLWLVHVHYAHWCIVMVHRKVPLNIYKRIINHLYRRRMHQKRRKPQWQRS
jgi:hypothetical protein